MTILQYLRTTLPPPNPEMVGEWIAYNAVMGAVERGILTNSALETLEEITYNVQKVQNAIVEYEKGE